MPHPPSWFTWFNPSTYPLFLSTSAVLFCGHSIAIPAEQAVRRQDRDRFFIALDACYITVIKPYLLNNKLFFNLSNWIGSGDDTCLFNYFLMALQPGYRKQSCAWIHVGCSREKVRGRSIFAHLRESRDAYKSLLLTFAYTSTNGTSSQNDENQTSVVGCLFRLSLALTMAFTYVLYLPLLRSLHHRRFQSINYPLTNIVFTLTTLLSLHSRLKRSTRKRIQSCSSIFNVGKYIFGAKAN